MATDNLLTPTGIKLFGRKIAGLKFEEPDGDWRTELGGNQFLRKQLADGNPQFARIYAISYEGKYRELPRPAIFLVHGAGIPVSPDQPYIEEGSGADKVKSKGKRKDADTEPDQPTFASGPGDASGSGVAAKDWELSFDIRMWEYDKGDFSIRLDMETGPFEQLLLDALPEVGGPGAAGHYAGRAYYAGRGAYYAGRGAYYSGRGTRGGRGGDDVD